ncbi:MAG: ACP S-malonyltransferase [Gammaproteobacteria bacterium]
MGSISSSPARGFACVFPGQGSQSVGMLQALAAQYAVVEATFASASDVLGYDLWQLVQKGPEEELNQTTKTQPAMLAAGVAVWRVWRALGGPGPIVMAGHSLGEYTALVCADALAFEAAVALVAERGRLMQAAVPGGVGAMAAILGLDDDGVRAACAAAAQGEIVAAVNFNSPGQVVIAGHNAAVRRAMTLAKAAGAKRAVPLAVSVPSHCALMRDGAEQLAERLAAVLIDTPRIPVLHNADVATYTDAAAIRDALTRQLYQPVRWVETINALPARGVSTVLECGPGKVLTGLAKRIDPTLIALSIYDDASLQQALAST